MDGSPESSSVTKIMAPAATTAESASHAAIEKSGFDTANMLKNRFAGTGHSINKPSASGSELGNGARSPMISHIKEDPRQTPLQLIQLSGRAIELLLLLSNCDTVVRSVLCRRETLGPLLSHVSEFTPQI